MRRHTRALTELITEVEKQSYQGVFAEAYTEFRSQAKRDSDSVETYATFLVSAYAATPWEK